MKKFYFLLLGLFLFSGVQAQIVNIPDANFKAKLLVYWTVKDLSGSYFKIDANNNGEIEVSEAQNVSELSVTNSNISDLTGIEYFTNLQKLSCFNNQIPNLNLTGLNILQELWCFNNQIPNLNLTGLNNLKALYCNGNQLTNLNLTGLNNLQTLHCYNNQIANLNLTGLNNLIGLNCRGNKLTNLNLTGLNNLQGLNCGENQLTNLNLTGLNNLHYLYCSGNQLTTLDVNDLIGLQELYCSLNQLTILDTSGLLTLLKIHCGNSLLTTLNIKNNSIETDLDFSGSLSLQYICADDSQIDQTQNLITQYGYSNCHVNSYCSFTPGGTFYTIQGNNRYDSNNNGCDVLDLPAANLKFSITDGTNIGSVIANTSGSYSIPVQAGTQTITPALENPSYFTVSPTTTTVTFPTQASPATQDFCVTANGVHPDLEVTLLPITRARPGFDANYKIIYKNKGTNTQSGLVNFNFSDSVLDFVSANPATSTQSTNNLSWAFANLLPFETREILVTLNVNSPVETPAVNGGDVLAYNTTITSAATDETPTDNTFALNQTVVNAFDPNDKTCLEGTTIAPSSERSALYDSF